MITKVSVVKVKCVQGTSLYLVLSSALYMYIGYTLGEKLILQTVKIHNRIILNILKSNIYSASLQDAAHENL